MPNNNTFTFQELSDFVNSQKDDRKINMHGAVVADNESVGCILVHFGRKKYHEKIDRVGYNSIFTKRNNRTVLSNCNQVSAFIQSCIRKNITNYRQAKQILNSM